MAYTLFSRAAGLAQNADGDVKMEYFEMGIVLDNGIYAIVPHIKIATVKKTSLVRLYRQ